MNIPISGMDIVISQHIPTPKDKMATLMDGGDDNLQSISTNYKAN
jgi:hypothetical protein